MMKGTKRTAAWIIPTISVLTVSIIGCWLMSHREAPAQNGRSLSAPTWQVGDWWVEERARVALELPKPEWVLDKVKFKVEAIIDVEGYPAYKVSEAIYLFDNEEPRVDRYLYFRKDDLSLFQVEEPLGLGGERPLIRMQTPGQPAWGEGYSFGWPVFPLREGETKAGFADPWYFLRADGTKKPLSETGEVQFFRNQNYGTKKGEEHPRQEVSVETVQWGGQQREVFRVRFRQLSAEGVVDEFSMTRWLPDRGWPVQGWNGFRGGGGIPPSYWSRLIASSRGLTFEIPRPRVEGFVVVEGQ